MTPMVRCAIYTRKSSDEGLDQDFNSLEAQRDACAAYVESQKHEGWRLTRTRYDDGGLSGGTLERPALQSLLDDIDAGRIAMVVVYKIDRLTRSLSDFAKLVDRFEAAGCSFVSVTQAFNTSSSMGRLTLNVLLSFAQFEREVTAERIRDKIAASKKKGMWMGGNPPLGYDPHPDRSRRELVVNPTEAETVLSLFRLYQNHGSLTATAHAASAAGLRSKVRRQRTGATRGGHPLSRGQIHALLRNPIYLGRIRHKDKIYDGRHAAIIDTALWDDVQRKLDAASDRRYGQCSTTAGPNDQAALIGRMRDDHGDRLTPTHTIKDGRRYTYYVSNRLVSGGRDPSGWRLPARPFERIVGNAIATNLADHETAQSLLATPDLRQAHRIREPLAATCSALQAAKPDILRRLTRSVELADGRLGISLDLSNLADGLGLPAGSIDASVGHITTTFEVRRRGVEMKLVAGTTCALPDPTLVQAIRNATRWSEQLRSGRSLHRLAREEGHSERYVARIAALALLAPRIQLAILEGENPAELTLEKLLATAWPLDWSAQEAIAALPA